MGEGHLSGQKREKGGVTSLTLLVMSSESSVDVEISKWTSTRPLRQILEDDALSGLIDEFYFEHHVHNHPLTRRNFGWGPSVQQTNCTVVDSYEVFARLRQLGIRAHSWV